MTITAQVYFKGDVGNPFAFDIIDNRTNERLECVAVDIKLRVNELPIVDITLVDGSHFRAEAIPHP